MTRPIRELSPHGGNHKRARNWSCKTTNSNLSEERQKQFNLVIDEVSGRYGYLINYQNKQVGLEKWSGEEQIGEENKRSHVTVATRCCGVEKRDRTRELRVGMRSEAAGRIN